MLKIGSHDSPFFVQRLRDPLAIEVSAWLWLLRLLLRLSFVTTARRAWELLLPLLPLLFFILLTPLKSQAEDIIVGAYADRNQVTVGEYFTLSVSVSSSQSVSTNGLDLSSLALKNFDIDRNNVSKSQQSRSVFDSQGLKTTRTKIFHYQLVAQREGVHKIGPFEVAVSGTKYQTPIVEMKVVKAGSRPPQDQRRKNNRSPSPGLPQLTQPFQKFFGHFPKGQGGPRRKADLFIRAEVDKKRVYVGEPIMVSWHIYTTGILREIDTLGYPSNKGFWKEDIYIASNLNFSNEVINGVPHRKALLASYALFPLKEGRRRLMPIRLRWFLSKVRTLVLGDLFNISGRVSLLPLKLCLFRRKISRMIFRGLWGNLK